MRVRSWASLAPIWGLFACGNGSPAPIEGNAALGVVRFEVTETADRLIIVGLDAKAAEVARAAVERGPFVMSEQFAEDRVGAARNVQGRQLDLKYKSVTLHHESEGTDVLILPLPPNPDFDLVY